jgi:phosphohistidine phosphatase
MKLYIVRHAWAGERGDPRYPDDRLRPLTEEGRKRFASVVKKLVERGFKPRLIATSPLVRCLQTAEVIAELTPGRPRVIERDELAPDSRLEPLLKWTASQEEQPVAWVGHAPDVCQLAAALIGDASASIRFAKGGACAIEFTSEMAIGRGELQWLASAKLLGC